MGANRELTITERSQIIGLFKGGHKRSDIGKILGFKVDTVKKNYQALWCLGNANNNKQKKEVVGLNYLVRMKRKF